MESIRQLAKEHNVESSMVFSRLRKGWSLQEALMPKGWKREQDIQSKIYSLDNEIKYLGGYDGRNSKISLKCNRCGNIFERTYERLVQKKYENKLCCEVCQTNNSNKLMEEERKKHFIETIKHTQPYIKYISGFKDNKGQVLVECKICGDRFYRTVDKLMRKNEYVSCLNCKKIEQERIKTIDNLLKEQKKYLQDIKRKHTRELNKLYKELNKSKTYILKCKCCNEEMYARSNNKTMCYKCAMKKRKRNHSNKSLKQLYEKEKGICYICGEKCDYEDYVYRGNTFIAGNYYPSIDHLIPLIKGGTDDWNNLRLAHRICNSRKSDKVLTGR